ncbi:hypothetical protein [Microbacterium sp. H83]|uniref:hypothetical protein n=1 Tax=Microbacterium sp. H83 TaxID=1827324 RepID=UPI0007F41064|nr:hypothetical protein [Microbacterium sp. H83]OAN37660.1 hypothetical protein A4X16_16375 [Microbacterium sp. H83]
MIAAGLALLAVGAADLVRQFAPRRWVGYLTIAIVLLLLGSVGDALLPMFAALLIGALWVWSMPADRPAPLGFWPAVLLAAISVGAVVWIGPREDAGLIGSVWNLRSPFGDVSFDLAMLALGTAVFLLESGNLVVRAALDGEHTWRPIEVSRAHADATVSTESDPAARAEPDAAASTAAGAEADPVTTDARGDAASGTDATRPDPALPLTAAAAPRDPRAGFKGGRLIGPLERILVLILTLAAAYPILAAMLAAKGIVRFPEISRDGETGARAEYFLVGSLVSWVIGLGGAFLIWWATHS